MEKTKGYLFTLIDGDAEGEVIEIRAKSLREARAEMLNIAKETGATEVEYMYSTKVNTDAPQYLRDEVNA